MKTLFQLVVSVALFFSTWFLLSRVDWVELFKIEKRTQSTEDKLGDLLWSTIKETEHEVYAVAPNRALKKLVGHLCEANAIDSTKIKVHIIEKDEVNAFALPGNHLVVYSGLLGSVENEAELIGVLGHEIAHMEKHHVMKKLIKEIGLSVLVSMAGGGGGQVVLETAKLLSSSAYDRDLESEADLTSVDYLIKADIDPEGLANFLYRLSDKEGNMPDAIYWIATHPESKERAETIVDYIQGKSFKKKTVLSEEQWKSIKEEVKAN